ncbi:uncharacterized protein LOC108426261 [Pygocentrus nattereri]|uniref:uncharacterized protein LOC108426261 n=1 Tax=Pygocentrus nattereri TaxID=42514 RepID=UPI000814609D|nr:uncharacterized protein LOC108426261 [Pygocentrus nattereri]
MEESQAKLFLEGNRSAVVNGVREVKRLVDFLMEKKYLRGEMPNEILSQKTKQDQMRELYKHLNTNTGFKLTLEWLRENEPDLIKDLEKNSDTDHAGPERKRPRSSEKAMDEIDSDPNMPNLRCLSTLHKLEKWVSASENSQNLIGMLNSKLAEGEMDTLEKQLMNKKLKKGLCFSAKDIKDIYSNQKLLSYFDTNKDAKFPDLPLKLFFGKDGGLASARDDDDDDHGDDHDDDVVTDSAYGSSYSASYSSSNSLFSKHLSQSEDQLQSDDLATTCESIDLRHALHNVKKTTDSKPQNTSMSPEETLSKQHQIHHAAQGQCTTHTQIQQTPNTQVVQEVLKIDTFTTEPFQPNTLNVAGDYLIQREGPQMNHDPDPYVKFKVTDMPSQKECRAIVFSKQRQELPDAHCQNGSLVQMQHADRDGTLLEELMDTQVMHDEPNTQSARKMLTGKPGEGPLPFTSLQVAADGPVPSEGPWADGDMAQLDKPLNLQESEPNQQRDPEMANSEPLVGNDCVGVVVDSVMQGGVQRMHCDPDPFTECEGTGMAYQKECRGFDILKQKQELPDAHCQNGSLVQMQHADKDGTPLEEPMDTKEMLNEPSIQSNKEMLFGKPCAPEPLLCTSMQGAPDDPVQTEGPEGPQEESSSQTITTHSDKTNMPSQKSSFPKQTRDFNDALRPDGDDPLLDKNEANIKFAKMANNESYVSDPGCLGVAAYSLMQSKGPHIDPKEGSEAGALIQNKDTEVPPQDQTVDASHTLQGQDGNRTGLMCISEAGPSYRNSAGFTLEMPDQKMSYGAQARFCSTPLNDSVNTAPKFQRRKQQNKRKLNKTKQNDRLLYEWAKKKCPKGSDEEVNKVFECISFENHVEHSEYPCFITENVMVYEDPQTRERQIIITDDKNCAAKKNLPKEIKILLTYQMWVCGIPKALLINQKEREVQFDLQFLERIKNCCEKFVFEALAPALAVFKNLQRRERLYSLIKNH